jgi:cyclopropane fatty-acyl-phospholipid synthase-like methyltransferase
MMTNNLNDLYSKSHIEISKLIGRKFNNPFSEDYLQKVVMKYVKSTSKVLDIGSGKGSVPITLCKNNKELTIDGLELSIEMINESKKEIEKEKLEDKINIINEDIFNYKKKGYDAVIGLDSFCYFENPKQLIEKIDSLLVSGGHLIFSEYFTNDKNMTEEVNTLINHWKIRSPLPFGKYKELLKERFNVLEVKETTSIYLQHWKSIREKVVMSKKVISEATSKEAFISYLNAVDTIINAVHSGSYGHVLHVAKKV